MKKDIIELINQPNEIINSTPIGIILLSSKFEVIWCNKRIIDFLGFSCVDEFIEKFISLSPQYQPNGKLTMDLLSEYYDIAKKEGSYYFNWLHVNEQGKEFPLEVTFLKHEISKNETGVVAYLRDLSGEFLDDNSSSNYENFFLNKISNKLLVNTLANLSNEWFFVLDARTFIVQFLGNINLQSIFPSNEPMHIDETINHVNFHPDDQQLYIKLVDNMKNGVYEDIDIRYLQADGTYHFYRIIYKTISDENHNATFVIGRAYDVQEQKQFEENAQIDLLTGCYNKITAENLVGKKILENKEACHALFIVDIDNFKAVNDNLGHFFGDEVLKEVSHNLKKSFRAQDIIARIGGDEFVVFFDNISSKETLKIKAQLIVDAFNRTYSGSDKEYKISGSVGIACYPNNALTYKDLYKAADKALYQAKMQGKDQYVFYTEALVDGTLSNLTKLENADRMASTYFDYELITAIFNKLYEHNGNSASIENALMLICQKYDVDRCFIHESFDKGITYNNTFEWCKEGISKELNNLQNISYSLYEELFTKSHNGIIYSNDIKAFFSSKNAYDITINQGIKSFIHAQVVKDDHVSFFLGLDDCTKHRVWNEKEINSLQYISKMISIILQGTHLREDVKSLTDYNQMSAFISDSSDDIVYVSDIDTYELYYLNKAALNLLGNPKKSEWIGKKCYELLQGKNAPCEFCTNTHLTENNFYTWKYFNPLFKKTYWLKDKLIPVNSKLARLEIATDITKIISLEEQLQEKLNEEKLLVNCINTLHSGRDPHESIDNLLDIIANFYHAERSYIFDTDEETQLLNNTFEWCADGIVPQINNLKNVSVNNVAHWYEKFNLSGEFYLEALDENSPDYEVLHPQGITSLISAPLRDNEDKITGFIGVDNPKKNIDKTKLLRSISKVIANFLDETQLLHTLNNISYYDTLTGVKNRNSYNKILAEINQKPISSLGVAYVDIRALRSINDLKGMQYGDAAIKKLAAILTDIFAKNVYRVGGDEFVVLMQNISEIDFDKSIDLLKSKTNDISEFKVSIGSTWNKNYEHQATASDISHGKKYDAILASNLDKEIANGKYVVYFQPQIDITTETFSGAEALVRRLNAKGGVDGPNEFIPFYEKEGIISKIDLFIFEQVCKYLQTWKDKVKDNLTISVNFSRATIIKANIVNILSELCEKYGVKKSQLIIEITETICGEDEDVLSAIINSFSQAGFEISIDDFGSGFSNFSTLTLADFDELKIDINLIRKLKTDNKSRTLVKAILNLCNHLEGIKCVAEGIETREQYEILKEFSCDIGQGYLFGRPIPAHDFESIYIYK